MEHGQRGAESIGAILSGIAEILREVSDKLDAVAARVDDNPTNDGDLAGRLAKLEAWAFRTEQDVSKLGARVEAVESGPAKPAEAGTRAERRELAARAEQELPTRSEPALPTRSEPALPTRGEPGLPIRGEHGLPTRGEHELPTRSETPPVAARTERRLPRAAANRGERTETTPAHSPGENLEPVAVGARATQADTNGERRMPPVPAALHDWVEPVVPVNPPSEPAPRAETPIAPAPPAPPAHDRQESFTPRYEPVPVSDVPAAPGQHGMEYGGLSPRSDRLDAPANLNGRLEPASPNGRADSGMTAPRSEPEANGAHRSTIEDNGHVDKLQAMLDELKRNPNGPFGRPLSNPSGEMPT
ncbi:hypothetical protein [Nocardia sp. NPDC050710]|uniref:hypothetical protein n=1 Tax=Nocardia sp. NPDC050710 TaxID=3157220 RepID=UPI0033D9EB94